MSRTGILRAAAIPLSTYCRSAFGVGFSVLPSREDPGRCFCTLFGINDHEPESCATFRQSLFDADAVVLTRCPEGLAVVALPVSAGDGGKAVLVSDSFFEEGHLRLSGDESPHERDSDDVMVKRFKDAPRLSAGETDLLVQFMESITAILPLLGGNGEKRPPADAKGVERREEDTANTLIGSSEAISRIRDALPTLANSREPVLIESEPGNGRNLIASILHYLGPSKEGPFICEDLSFLPEAFQDRELFGSKEKGRRGIVGRAAGGTLFLNAIDRLSSSAQRSLVKYLSAVDTASRVKGPEKDAFARIVASSDYDLKGMVRKGRFRDDLQQHLSRLILFVPPLRERKEDIPALAQHLLRRLTSIDGREPVQIQSRTLAALREYSWPGNVRELERELEKAAALGQNIIGLKDFSAPVRHAVHPPRARLTNIREAVGNLEIEMITTTLTETNWNKSRASRILGLSRLGLQKKIDRYGLDRRR